MARQKKENTNGCAVQKQIKKKLNDLFTLRRLFFKHCQQQGEDGALCVPGRFVCVSSECVYVCVCVTLT